MGYCANPSGLQNANFCVGCFESYLCKTFATAPKIRKIHGNFAIFAAEFSLAELFLVD